MPSVEASSPALSLASLSSFTIYLSGCWREERGEREREGWGDEFKIRMLSLSLSLHALLSLLLSLAGLKLLLLSSGQNSYLPGGVRVLTDKARLVEGRLDCCVPGV